MALALEQLITHLRNNLSPCYLLFGDEPQQKMMALDAIRRKATEWDFHDRTKLKVEPGFDWLELRNAYLSMSLFSDKQFIEIELSSLKIGAEGAQALIEMSGHFSSNLLVVIHGPAINKEGQKTKWFSTLDAIGTSCFVYTLDEAKLVTWIRQQLQERGLGNDSSIAKIIADCCEGNMLAAAQEIEKLTLQFDGATLSLEDVISAVTQQSRFTLFQFVDALLQGNVKKTVRILLSLEAEGIEPNYVLWALSREWQILHEAKTLEQTGKSINWLAHVVWHQRQPLYQKALQRLTRKQLDDILHHIVQTDHAFKQSNLCRPFVTLAHISMLFLGFPAFHFSVIHA